MPDDEINLLDIKRGTVTAPAGCGKTHLIAQAISRHGDKKPILVLTHTNAGVAALRGRLEKAGVPAKAYRLSTIDGWAMRLIATFPKRSGCDPTILKLETSRRLPHNPQGCLRIIEGWPFAGCHHRKLLPIIR